MANDKRLDLPARIKALAELEGPCPNVWADPKGLHYFHCQCGGTGRIVLFKELRILCPGHQASDTAWFGQHHKDCFTGCSCSGRGWVPEPNLRVACWELAKLLEQDEGIWYWYDKQFHTWRYEDGTKLGHPADSAEEAVVSGAEAWAKEKVK